MPDESKITAHYSRGDLRGRLNAALRDDGVDPFRPDIEALAPYDQFHGRGLEATQEMAESLAIAATDHILDVGSGIGGPARYLARRFSCRITGIDLTPEFCEVARHLSQLLQMDDAVRFEVGNALAMPFTDATFDGAYSMNVSMNIADKPALYREIRRVLKQARVKLKLEPILKWDFYKAVESADHILTIQTGDQALWANVLLTIGCRQG